MAPIYVDTQHDDMVHDAQLDYYGTKLATSSSGMFILFCCCCVYMDYFFISRCVMKEF